MLQTLCTAHGEKTWRRKWKHLGYGKNLLLLLNRVVLIITRKNVSSVTYNNHRNRISRTFTEGEYMEWLLGWAEVIQVPREKAWVFRWKSRLSEAGRIQSPCLETTSSRGPPFLFSLCYQGSWPSPHKCWPLRERVRTALPSHLPPDTRGSSIDKWGRLSHTDSSVHIDVHPDPTSSRLWSMGWNVEVAQSCLYSRWTVQSMSL